MTSPVANLSVTFRGVWPDDEVVRMAHRCAACLSSRHQGDLIIAAHRDGFFVQLHAVGSALVVAESASDVFLAIRNVFARWNAVVDEHEQHARRRKLQ